MLRGACTEESECARSDTPAETMQQAAGNSLFKGTHNKISPLPKYIFDSDLISQTADLILVKSSKSNGFLSGKSEVQMAT